MASQIKAVVFDIGNVLIEWNPEKFYDRTIGRTARERLFAQVDLHGMHVGVDLGDPFCKTVYDFAACHPDHADAIRMWHDDWAELASPRIDESWTILRALKNQGVPVFALSNFGAEAFEISKARYPELSEFDRCYLSGAMRCMKPAPEIYERMEADCGLAGSELFFTDDRPENIDAAVARGWHAHLFEGAEGLRRRLVAEGLLAPSP